jgi:hypothetical protein
MMEDGMVEMYKVLLADEWHDLSEDERKVSTIR